MQTMTVSRVLVWGRWLRLAHWSMALSTIGLLMTGWLMSSDPLLAHDAREYHYMLSALLLSALALRIYLLFFGKGTDLLEDCEPDRHKLKQALGVVKFYLTLGRSPLPKWFSHNPLWGPFYLLLIAFLLISCTSGLLLLNEMAYLGPLSNHDLHVLSNTVIGLFVLLHLPAVFCHDMAGSSSDISGMINGHRTFLIGNQQASEGFEVRSVSVKNLMKGLK